MIAGSLKTPCSSNCYINMAEPLPIPEPSLFALMTERVRDYAIFLLDPRGHIASWNTGARLIKQYSREEILGQHFSIFYTPEDKARGWPDAELRRATMDGRFEDEGWRVRKDGSRFWANVIITALRDDSGVLLGFSKITRDLTETRRQQEALRQSEERFRLLVEGVQDYAIYMLSPDGVVTSWNAGARRITGYEAGEIIGKHFSRFYATEDMQAGRPWNELAIARETGRAEDEGWRVRKDGTRFWARVAVTSLRDASGELRGFAKVTQDLSLQRHSEALEQAASRVNDFLAILAHELRNPLAPIRNAVELLRSLPPGQDFELMLRALDRQSAQLGRIVDDLLDISRITRGTFELQKRELDLREVLSRALEAAGPRIEAAHHALVVDLPQEAVRAEADDMRLTQAFTNLLNNAAQYTDPGGRIWVRLRRDERTGEAEVSVRDTGCGIEPHLLGSVFGMFVQGRREAGRTAGGLGVGLALARTIVERHHGSIAARSGGPGLGAEFIVRIPAMKAPEAAAGTQPEVPAPRGKSPSRRVLVVDDNQDAAIMLSALVKALGHEVLTVHDGVEALRVSEGYRPELIMLDIGMPGMSGYEVARRLRERKRGPRPIIVAVTGWGTNDDQMRSKEAGIDVHLVKPVEEAQLRRVMDQASGAQP